MKGIVTNIENNQHSQRGKETTDEYTYIELIDIKEKRLQYSAISFGVAIFILAVGLFFYLIRPL